MARIHHHNGCFEDGLPMRVKKILYDESSSGNLVKNQPFNCANDTQVTSEVSDGTSVSAISHRHNSILLQQSSPSKLKLRVACSSRISRSGKLIVPFSHQCLDMFLVTREVSDVTNVSASSHLRNSIILQQSSTSKPKLIAACSSRIS
ncbi:hypothetical protein WN944_022096 [Citrus x changshan-huyou]|uniref:Uncharacterized protein n=1 Tax=Citrus x changshan-huyou TaxID=2935761 RepID=A0AAP0R040_9ROSI